MSDQPFAPASGAAVSTADVQEAPGPRDRIPAAPVRLVVDALFLRPGRVGGIEFMLYSLLAALTATKGPDDRIAVLLAPGVDLPARFPSAADGGPEPITLPKFGNRFTTVERYLPAERDVALFPNYYTPWSATRDRDRPTVTVVHDLQFRAFPQNFTPFKRAFQHAALRHTCRRATGVVAISEHTAGEVGDFRPGVRDRLTVIPNPVDWARFDREAAPEGHGDLDGSPYFLLAAAQYRHKNIISALDGFRRVREHRPDARLVLVGQVPEGMRETKVSVPLPQVPGVVALGFVSDDVLAWLYRRATAVLLPSLYEGCGLPCAEALGLGTPVIHSGRGALPEVVGHAGGAGVAVDDPLAPSAWSDAMGDALAGRLPAPTPETSAAMRAAHDVGPVGRRYWQVIRAARDATTSGRTP